MFVQHSIKYFIIRVGICFKYYKSTPIKNFSSHRESLWLVSSQRSAERNNTYHVTMPLYSQQGKHANKHEVNKIASFQLSIKNILTREYYKPIIPNKKKWTSWLSRPFLENLLMQICHPCMLYVNALTWTLLQQPTCLYLICEKMFNIQLKMRYRPYIRLFN